MTDFNDNSSHNLLNISEALRHGRTILAATSDTASLDTEILLCFVLSCKTAYLYTYTEKNLTNYQREMFNNLINSRKAGTPIAYLTNHQEFWSLPLLVSNKTLIPRPETELLVEKSLNFLDKDKNNQVLDLGTGSGAIAIAIAKSRPNWDIIAVEKSHDAMAVAKENARNLQINNIKFISSDWFSEIDELRFTLIISNPPYIAADDRHLSEGDVRFEPREALISGANGLEDLEYIIKHSYHHLVNGGMLLLEHGFQQGEAVCKLLVEHGYTQVTCFPDLQWNNRVSFGLKL